MNDPKPVYLDYNASTPVDPRVLEAMLPFLREHFGNPSCGHAYGHRAKEAVEFAREQVAGLLGCAPDEVIFTSGGSEGNNTAIKGICLPARRDGKGNHIVTSEVEHPSVSRPLEFLRRQGFSVTAVPVDACGRVNARDVESALTQGTVLVTIMHANNEVGTIQPIREIAQVTRARGVLLHTDAAQTAGKIPAMVRELGVDMLTIAGHKMYAPKGVGAMYTGTGVPFEPLVHGAGHESGRRAGTENVASIVALGKACEIASNEMAESSRRIKSLRDRLHQGILQADPAAALNGHPDERLPNTLNISFSALRGGDALAALPQLAASTGAACHDRQVTASETLAAMGVSHQRAAGAVRLSLGRFTTEEEIDRALEMLQGVLRSR